MTLTNFTRLADAKPNFVFEKIRMPYNFNSKIQKHPIKVESPILNHNLNATTINPVSEINTGIVATYIVLGSIAVIIVTIIYINQTT